MHKVFDFIGYSMEKIIYNFLYFMDNHFWSVFIVLLFGFGIANYFIHPS